jgi:hypothetical protein
VPAALVARDRPLSTGCLEEGVAGGAVAAATGEGAVEGMLRHAADVLGAGAWAASGAARQGFEAAARAVCARFAPEPTVDLATGEAIPPDVEDLPCGPAEGELPGDLRQALAPVMWAIHDGVVARMELDAQLEARDPGFWRDHGGKGLLASRDMEAYDAAFPEDRAFLAADRGQLYGAAAALAGAVEAVDWAAFRGREGVRYDFQTPAGWIRVRGAEADRYPPAAEDTLLLVDLGGDDVHLDQVASNTSGANAVSVVVDVGGADTYGYEQAMTAALDGPRLPPDGDGVVAVEGQVRGASASEAARQGAARNGIAMLFDLGGGEDRYVALRASQGYAHQGVGVLFDDGGEDSYLAETAAQGAGQFGIGILLDLGPEGDVRRSSHASQGFGYVAGVGVLYDAGGDDLYRCHPDHGGDPAYVAPQMPGEANSSMCQGAGLGFRIRDEDHALAGGVGVLVDREGDDAYEAGVYAQGTGYWQGFGLLSDRSGSDRYDAFYYAQGAAAHFGVGILADGGAGNDHVGGRLEAQTMVMGAAQDFAVGVFVNEGGDDTYALPARAGAAAMCGSVTVFVDNGGRDAYAAPAGQAAGVARARDCGENVDVVSTAVFLDASGQDAWDVPGEGRANDRRWRSARPEDPGARAVGEDTQGVDSGVHVRGR